MVLLDVLRQRPGVSLTVAHFDHGIRPDSRMDRQHVQAIAKQHGLPFVYHRQELGQNASESVARDARYDFLRKVQNMTGAKAIVTAHHQDDRLETAVHNMMRGSGRRGYAPLTSTDGILRPLVTYPKTRLIEYAKDHGIMWREDSTNSDTRYKRNYIRHNLLSQLSDGRKAQLHILLDKIDELNKQIERELVHVLHLQDSVGRLDRHWFTQLPHRVATEVMYEWLTRHGVHDITSSMIERLVHAAKTSQSHKKYMVQENSYILTTDDAVEFVSATG